MVSDRTQKAPMPRPSAMTKMSLLRAKAPITPSKENDASSTSR